MLQAAYNGAVLCASLRALLPSFCACWAEECQANVSSGLGSGTRQGTTLKRARRTFTWPGCTRGAAQPGARAPAARPCARPGAAGRPAVAAAPWAMPRAVRSVWLAAQAHPRQTGKRCCGREMCVMRSGHAGCRHGQMPCTQGVAGGLCGARARAPNAMLCTLASRRRDRHGPCTVMGSCMSHGNHGRRRMAAGRGLAMPALCGTACAATA